MSIKKLAYTGSSKIVKNLVNTVNALIDQGGGGSYEIIHQSNVAITDNTQVTLNLQHKYTTPFVFAVNSLPLSSWGGLIVVQTSTISYSSTDDTLTFNVYTNTGQNYDVDWIVMER